MALHLGFPPRESCLLDFGPVIPQYLIISLMFLRSNYYFIIIINILFSKFHLFSIKV